MAIMGHIADEIVGKKLADRYSWGFAPSKIKNDLTKLIFTTTEAVEAVLPLVATTVTDPYEASRDLSSVPPLGAQISEAISAHGSSLKQRFAPLLDVTES